jgi:hypothetical protein
VFHLFLYFDSHGPRDAGGPRPTGRYIYIFLSYLITMLSISYLISMAREPFL